MISPDWDPWHWLAFGALAGVIINQIRIYWIKPAWQGIKTAVDVSRAHQVLMGIAREFRTDSGTTLKDDITGLQRGLDELTDAVDELKNHIDIHIASTLPGGRRATDPQAHPEEDPE